jgi:hypothetical protein
MPEKEVSKSHQTFHAAASATSFEFGFYKVYKRQAKNRFRVRVIQIADFDNSNDGLPLMYVASGGFMNTSSVVSHIVDAVGNGMKANDFVLGITNRNRFAGDTTNGSVQAAPIEFYTDEISISPFTIRYYDLGSATYGTSDIVSFAITFEITELEEV